MDFLNDWLIERGLDAGQADLVTRGASLVGLALLSFVVHRIARYLLSRSVARLAKKTRTDLDDVLVRRRFFARLAHLAPALVIWFLAPLALAGMPQPIALALNGVGIYMIVVGVLVVDAALNAADDLYQKLEVSKRVPIRGYIQVVKIVAASVAVILVLSLALGKSPLVLLSGLGALTAVILLIFKDTILGLVAGVQLGANDMVRPGDWIEMKQFGADGDVMEVALTTVKVRNWDKTITTIPSYALISDSFRNWRGMTESGGRRIKRSVFIDVNSIRFCTPEMIERFARISRITDYVRTKTRELEEYNAQHGIDQSVPANGRRMTNVGTFRAYLLAYLREHPEIHREMTFLVRQLQPTEKGLPLEIYIFSRNQDWVAYEAIQADIFDHILAALPEFDLRPFQSPSGHDVASAGAALATRGNA